MERIRRMAGRLMAGIDKPDEVGLISETDFQNSSETGAAIESIRSVSNRGSR